MDLSNVSIVITTFLRDGYLFDCIAGIIKNLPECKIIVVDDGHTATDKDALFKYLREEGHKTIHLTFDSGLSAKRNLAAKLADTEYVLIGCDDFDFSTLEVRRGIARLVEVLDYDPLTTIASGHVNNSPYEGFLSLENGVLTETNLNPNIDPSEIINGIKVYPIDLSVNYFLARKEVLVDNPWDERMKIGGEHGDFFLQLKHKKNRTVLVTNVNINTLPEDSKKQDSTYGSYRGRAVTQGHTVYLQKNGITKFIGFSGYQDTLHPDGTIEHTPDSRELILKRIAV